MIFPLTKCSYYRICQQTFSPSVKSFKGSIRLIFNNAGCKAIDRDGDVIANGSHQNDLFKLEQRKQDTKSVLACSSAGSLEIWHRRLLGHLDFYGVRNLANGLVTGVKVTGEERIDCKICPMGKHCRHPVSKGTRADGIPDLIHSDSCGSMEVKSLGGGR